MEKTEATAVQEVEVQAPASTCDVIEGIVRALNAKGKFRPYRVASGPGWFAVVARGEKQAADLETSLQSLMELRRSQETGRAL